MFHLFMRWVTHLAPLQQFILVGFLYDAYADWHFHQAVAS